MHACRGGQLPPPRRTTVRAVQGKAAHGWEDHRLGLNASVADSGEEARQLALVSVEVEGPLGGGNILHEGLEDVVHNSGIALDATTQCVAGIRKVIT